MRSLSARLRVFLVCAAFPVGCVDEDTNSATGSHVTVTEPDAAAPVTAEDTSGDDGVKIDCSHLFASNVSLASDDVSVRVSFPGDAKAGDEFSLADGVASVSVTSAADWVGDGGSLTVDANDTGADMRIGVTLHDVTDGAGHVLNGSLDCLETAGDTASRACFTAGSDGGGGGGGHHDLDGD